MSSIERAEQSVPGSRLALTACAVVAALALVTGEASGQSLRGSRASLDRQNLQARGHDFTYLGTAAELQRFVDATLLIPVRGNDDYLLKDVSFPYARPEVKLFVERLSAQFRAACGEPLVVTSLTRPKALQPRNASDRSVHPTGMAVDIRRHNTSSCRSWLEKVLLSLEKSGVLEATLERYPPHYHVAIYPEQYAAYVERITGRSPAAGKFMDVVTYRVSRKDTLWRIARNHGSTPELIRQANGLSSTTIFPGQLLKVPLIETAEH